ncbi:hypothetical protein NQ315_008054 [Exocentrus adspersus]|uniref:Transcriptional adapter n=1 Tax=Exocentrus adspersus TaxID=1586481 RepID=A0AAV8VW45_9CUCU|nr:hypothetical protein NQ315_008054 [Exocentrus adspersus]
MANTNTDLTEEDAADLQFPKDEQPSTSTMFNYPNGKSAENSETASYCANCFSELVYPYILCDVCNVNICSTCFSNGAEFLNHKNDHDYRVLNSKFVLFENSDWTADEELTLLESLAAYGNWNLVAQELPKRTVSEIMDHYDYFYLQRNGSQHLPEVEIPDTATDPLVVVPYRFRLTDSEDPPRYAPNTVGYQSLAGYNPARSEFENEYDKNAEDLLSNVEVIDENDPHHDLMTKLQCSLIEGYNRRLRERQRWKNVISKHGLLLLRKTTSWLHRYDLTLTRPIYEKMLRFMQVCEPLKYDMLMEGLHRVGELKLQISRLIQLRKKGITTLAEGKLYLKLNQLREENRKSLKLFRSNIHFNWRQCKNANIVVPKAGRRPSFAPLEIIGMPGYEKLTDKEADLCRNIRLVPITYLELKDVLVAEHKRTGHVKLQTARRLLKIDVNKTRKLYDFLVEEGYISKPK